jgi:hypothetical protein
MMYEHWASTHGPDQSLFLWVSSSPFQKAKKKKRSEQKKSGAKGELWNKNKTVQSKHITISTSKYVKQKAMKNKFRPNENNNERDRSIGKRKCYISRRPLVREEKENAPTGRSKTFFSFFISNKPTREREAKQGCKMEPFVC